MFRRKQGKICEIHHDIVSLQHGMIDPAFFAEKWSQHGPNSSQEAFRELQIKKTSWPLMIEVYFHMKDKMFVDTKT